MAVQEALAWGHVADAVRGVDRRRLVRRVIDEFREHQLLIASGGIAFRVLLATVVGALFVMGLLGFFGLSEVWRSDIAPDLRSSVSDPAFRLLNDAALQVLQGKAFFWVTAGAAIAIWQLSGVIRASGQTLNRIYETEESRSLPRELWDSIKAAVLVGALMIATLAVVRLGALPIDDVLGSSAIAAVVSFVVRWTVAAVLLTAAVGVVVRNGPTTDRPLHWVSFGSALTVAGWLVSSVLFGLYLSVFASFGSVYGVLLATFLLVEYLYVAAIVFLGGLVVDHLVREEGDRDCSATRLSRGLRSPASSC